MADDIKNDDTGIKDAKIKPGSMRYDVSRFSEYDIYLFKEGNHFRLYEKMGSHPMDSDGIDGTYFAVWAPNAQAVSVMGDFNSWNTRSHQLKMREDGSGIWEGFIPGIGKDALYKYSIVSKEGSRLPDKGDPFAFKCEISPSTASHVWDLEYTWNDDSWMQKRKKHDPLHSPVSVYEVHLGSWKRSPEGKDRFLTYRELADDLVKHVKDMGFTHVEFLPVMEHPFYGSWGYQVIGFYAPTSRLGSPQDLMYLIDRLHQNDIGVIIDWVSASFVSDTHGLIQFDGTHLYEESDPRKNFHPDWKSYIFNYGRNEISNFLIANALFWIDKYHVDGLRVDALASMLYLDYSRKNGDWAPNKYGGNENLEAVGFIKRLNRAVHNAYPDVRMIAEDSSNWPMVTRSESVGGLGFDMKWKMGWMNDTLEYFKKDPVHRLYHHGLLTFSFWYAFSENFMLPLSHDEVVYGKGSLMAKMPGDDWQKFANLRLLYGYMYTHPGKKLLFMGDEFGQREEWNHETELHWDLLKHIPHQGLRNWVRDLNHLYQTEPALYKKDFTSNGFEWIDCNDVQKSILTYLRKGAASDDMIMVVCNFTSVVRHDYRVGSPVKGYWKEMLNSDSPYYGGSGQGNLGGVLTTDRSFHGRAQSLSLTLPALGIVILKKTEEIKEVKETKETKEIKETKGTKEK